MRMYSSAERPHGTTSSSENGNSNSHSRRKCCFFRLARGYHSRSAFSCSTPAATMTCRYRRRSWIGHRENARTLFKRGTNGLTHISFSAAANEIERIARERIRRLRPDTGRRVSGTGSDMAPSEAVHSGGDHDSRPSWSSRLVLIRWQSIWVARQEFRPFRAQRRLRSIADTTRLPRDAAGRCRKIRGAWRRAS